MCAEKEDWVSAKAFAQKSIALNKTNKDAQELLKTVNSQNNSIALNKAIELFDAEKYDESLSIINSILASDSKYAYALYYRGMIYDTKKKYNEAIADYKKAASIDPEITIINYLIGVDYDMLEQYKNAVSYYKSFVANYTEDDDYKKYAQTRIGELKSYDK